MSDKETGNIFGFGYKNDYEDRNDIKIRGMYRLLESLYEEGILTKKPVGFEIESSDDQTHFMFEFK